MRIILDTHALDNVWFSASIVEFDLIGSEEHAYICTSVEVFCVDVILRAADIVAAHVKLIFE